MSKRNRKKRIARHPLESVAFRIGLAVIPPLPRPALLGIAWLAGTLGFLLDSRGRHVGLNNLHIAFRDTQSIAKKRLILHAAYVTMTRTFLDVIWFGVHSSQRLSTYVEIDPTMQQIFCNKNQICITAHFGNWEVLGLAVAQQGFPLHSIAMPVKNPEIDQLLIERRERTGQKIIPREGALRKVMGILRDGGKTAFLVDQNTKETDGGIWVTYFGLPVLVTSAPAALAAKTGSEIFIGFCTPLPRGRYRVYITETIQPPAHPTDETTRRLTQQILAAIEREVRKNPEHSLWMYKRWKTIQSDGDPTQYPSYSRRK